MKALFSQLERNIQEEIRVQQEIEKLLDQQLSILIDGGKRGLPETLKAAEAGILRSQQLDTERQGLLGEIGQKLGLSRDDVTLAKVTELLEEQDAEPSLAAQRDELRQVIRRVKELNRKVSLLCRHSVHFIEDLLSVLMGKTDQVSRTYTRQGKVTAAGGNVASPKG